MRQFGELGLKQRDSDNTDNYVGASTDGSAGAAGAMLGQKQAFQLNTEEIKIQAEADYLSDVIQQRNDNLAHVEQAMSDMN